MEIQHGDSPTPVMSFLGMQAEHPQQILLHHRPMLLS